MSERSPVAASVVLGVAVGAFGMSFGVLCATAGLSTAKACALSLLVFTGASQFTAVTVLKSGGSPAAALGSALLLAARNGAYGLAVSPFIRGSRVKRLASAQLVIDESTAMATAQGSDAMKEHGFYAAGLAVFVFWNLGTLIGALGGQRIGRPESLGLDAAFPAGFLALLVPHVRTVSGRRAAVGGALIALALVPVAPAGVPILAAGLAALVGLRSHRPERVGEDAA